MIPIQDFHDQLSKKLRNEERERQLLSKFLNESKEQGNIVEAISLQMIDKDSPRRKLYREMVEMFTSNKDVNLQSIKARINEKGNPAEKDQLLSEIEEINDTDSYDTVDNLSESLTIAFQNRVIFYDIIERANQGFTADIDPRELLADINKSITMAEPSITTKTFAQMVREAKQKLLNPTESQKGLKTGLKCLDDTYGGIIPDRYWTIGAESGNGKTSFLINILFRLCIRYPDRIAIILFSMEMSEERIIERIVSTIISMSSFKMNGRAEVLTEQEIRKIEEAYLLIESWPITLIYKTQTPDSLRRTFRKFALENKDKHLIGMVDHIGKIEGKGDIREVTIQASQACKSFCIDYKATVFVLTQLRKELSDVNNKANKDSYHRPNQSHIMESGAIKADSDVVILIWRPEVRFREIFYNNAPWSTQGRAILINEKNRDGQCPCDMIVKCEIQYNHFDDEDNPFSNPSAAFETSPEPEKYLWRPSEEQPPF